MSLLYDTDVVSIEQDRSGKRAAIALASLRVVIGWVFFYSGISKVLDPEWTASGYLTHAVPEGNPFKELWPVLADMPIVDPLVQFGLTLVGLGIILGAFTRWNTFWAVVMMLLFWASSLPLENGIVVDQHVVYVAVLIGLSTVRAGRIAGLDPYLESIIATDRRWLRYVMD